jgi:hypothetical protein
MKRNKGATRHRKSVFTPPEQIKRFKESKYRFTNNIKGGNLCQLDGLRLAAS